MARTADAVVVEVQARLDQASARTAEAGLDQSVNRMAQSAGKAEAAIGNSYKKITTHAGGARAAQMEMMHVARAASDQFAAGTPMTQIFAQHLAQVGQAASMSGQTLGKLGAFLATGWGLALTVAVVVLTKLVTKMFEAGDSVDVVVAKLREQAKQAKLTDEANDAFARTLEGVADAARKNRDALEELEKAGQSQAHRVLVATLIEQEHLKVIQATTRGLLEQARAHLLVTQGQAAQSGSLRESGASAEAQVLQSRINVLTTAISQLDAEAADVNRRVTEAANRVVAERASMGPIELIHARYDRLVEQAVQRGTAEKKTLDWIAQQTAQLREQERLAVAAEQKKSHKAKPDLPFGREVTAAEAAAIARAAGLQVNSADRPTWMRDETPGGGQSQERLYKAWVAAGRPSDNPVAAPGTSAHEAARGRWALDIQFGKGITPDLLQKVFATQGVRLTKVFAERGHFHVEGSRAGAAADEREAQKQQDLETRQNAAFAREMADLQAGILEATRGRVVSVQEQLEIDEHSVIAARDRDNAAYQAAADQHHVTQAQADLLVAKRNELATAQTLKIYSDEALRSAEVQRQLDIDTLGARAADAKFAADNARTGNERRAALMRVLQAEEDLERAKLNEIVWTTKVGSIENLRAQEALARLADDRARRTYQINNDPSNLSPRQTNPQSNTQTAAQIDEAIEGATVSGLEKLNDDLADAVMGTESLGEAFDNMANTIIRALIKIAIQQAIIKPIADLLFGAGAFAGGQTGGGLVPMGATGGGWLASILGSIFPGRASGGPVSAGQTYWVGENGPEPFVPSQSGTIIPNNRLAALAGGGRAAAPNLFSVTINAPGATAETVAMIRREIMNAAPMLVAASQRSTIVQLTKPRA